jgi:hypothetical protein
MFSLCHDMIAVPASRTQVPFVKLEGVSMLWTQRFEISHAHINPKTSIFNSETTLWQC